MTQWKSADDIQNITMNKKSQSAKRRTVCKLVTHSSMSEFSSMAKMQLRNLASELAKLEY